MTEQTKQAIRHETTAILSLTGKYNAITAELYRLENNEILKHITKRKQNKLGKQLVHLQELLLDHIESKKYWEHKPTPNPRTLHTERLTYHQKALERLQKQHHDKYEQLLNTNTNDTTKKQLKKEINQIIEQAITHKEAEEHYKRNLDHLTLLNAKEPSV